MRFAIQGWSNVGFLVRLGIVVLTGLTWAASGAQRILVRVDARALTLDDRARVDRDRQGPVLGGTSEACRRCGAPPYGGVQ